MKVLTPGHLYSLDNFEGGQHLLQFIHKEPVNPGSTELKTIDNGTTNEEVLRALLDRMRFLQKAFPCVENQNTITCLSEALYWLDKRTSDRLKRGVEGKQEK